MLNRIPYNTAVDKCNNIVKTISRIINIYYPENNINIIYFKQDGLFKRNTHRDNENNNIIERLAIYVINKLDTDENVNRRKMLQVLTRIADNNQYIDIVNRINPRLLNNIRIIIHQRRDQPRNYNNGRIHNLLRRHQFHEDDDTPHQAFI